MYFHCVDGCDPASYSSMKVFFKFKKFLFISSFKYDFKSQLVHVASFEPHCMSDTEPNLYLCRVFFGTAHIHIHSRHIIFPVQDKTDVKFKSGFI